MRTCPEDNSPSPKNIEKCKLLWRNLDFSVGKDSLLPALKMNNLDWTSMFPPLQIEHALYEGWLADYLCVSFATSLVCENFMSNSEIGLDFSANCDI